ncbi:hypothetical protein CMI37_09395 [Candidatus Pacearchaeota archaeon]|nr:hypothetical protein [Candidatus Pacearchaeota archaeon]
MGLSNRQFGELVVLLLFVILYPLLPLHLAKTYSTIIGFVSFIIPNTLILVYLYFKFEKKIDHHSDTDTVMTYEEVIKSG